MVSGDPSAEAAGGTISMAIYLVCARDKFLCRALVGVAAGFCHVVSLSDVEKGNPAHRKDERGIAQLAKFAFTQLNKNIGQLLIFMVRSSSFDRAVLLNSIFHS